MVCETEQQRSKVTGGFVLLEVPALMAAWQACQSRPLGVGDFRTWLACRELTARRCLAGKGRTPFYSPVELARLLGVSTRRAKASVGRLVTAGLIEIASDRIEFPGPSLEVEEEVIDTIGGGRGSVAIPRRMLRFLVDGARPALIATVLGILLRCLSRRREGFDSRGRVKASWIARVFEVDVRRVKAARAELIKLGWIEAEAGDQWALNRWGRAFRIDLGWDRPGRPSLPPPPVRSAPSLPPPPARSAPSLPPPESDQEPLRESKNQEPARAEPETTGVQVPDSGKIPAPKLDDVRPEDLRETGRLLKLFDQAVDRKLVSSSEADRLAFVSLAEHARSVGTSNPPGLFAALLRRGAWSFITQGDEDEARRRLRAYLWPVAPAPVSKPPAARVLSDDARMVREVSRALASAGYRGDPFPQMRRLDPSWTRERWDAARAELDRFARPGS